MKNIDINKIPNPEILGNKTLYDLCSNNIKNSNSEAVSAKTWLIGRSYAASPQRRRTKTAKKSYKHDFFFDVFARYFIGFKDIVKRIDKLICEINNSQYKGKFEDDKLLILKSLELIGLYNYAVVKTIAEIDNCSIDDSNLNNNISFSSKYLHFHCPDIIYIYDSYSKINVNKFIKPYKREFEIDKKITELKKYFQSEKSDLKVFQSKEFQTYISHFVKCYFTSILCNDSQQLTPRQVDTVLLTELWKENL